uniref:C2H2-type domain-containing protein n=1 Tax=Syphacia muris TaxID=451379 RepID=A0A158R5C1_9BILA
MWLFCYQVAKFLQITHSSRAIVLSFDAYLLYLLADNEKNIFSNWTELESFYCQQKDIEANKSDSDRTTLLPKVLKRDPDQLASSLELKNEIKVTSRINDDKNTYVYSWQCNDCLEKGVNTYYEVESSFSMRLHVIYHFLVRHQKDRRRLLGLKEKDLLEKEIGFPVVINSKFEEKLKGQLPSDIDLLSNCIDNPCLVSLLLASYSDSEKVVYFDVKIDVTYIKTLLFVFATKYALEFRCFGCIVKMNIAFYPGKSVDTTTDDEVVFHTPEEEQNHISVYSELLDDSDERQKLLNKILSPGGILCQSNCSAAFQKNVESDQDFFPSTSASGLENHLKNEAISEKAKDGFHANARSISCRHCKRRIPGSSKTGCHLRLVYHLFNEHKNAKPILLEAEREKLKLEKLLNTKLDFSDRSHELDSVVKKSSKSHLSSWLTQSRIKDTKVISFLQKESMAEDNVMVCFCYRTFEQSEPYLAHVRKAHVFKKIEMPSRSPLHSSSSCEGVDKKPEKVTLTQMQNSLVETVDSWYNKEISSNEKPWMCFICKRTLVPTTPRIARLDVFTQLHVMYHLATAHSDDQRANELSDFGRSLWKDRVGVELVFRKTLPTELRSTFNVQECLNVLFELNASLLQAFEVQSRVPWDRKNIMCFCFRVMGEKLILKHLRDEHCFHTWRCDVIPNASTGKPYRCYCRCYFCKAYLGCDFSELSLRLLAYLHLRKYHSDDPIAVEYAERERAYLESCLKISLSVLPELPSCSRLLTIDEARELFTVKDESFVSAIKSSAFQGINAPVFFKIIC